MLWRYCCRFFIKARLYLLIALLVVAGFIFLFIRFGYNDSQTLTGFTTAYQRFDQAIYEESGSVLSGSASSAANEQKADAALTDLKTKATTRISSLTKNDGEMMKVMVEVADLSTKELTALKAYQEAAADQSADMQTLGNQFRDLTTQRQSAYARFLQLSEH